MMPADPLTLLSDKLQTLQNALNLETDASVKFKLQHEIKAVELGIQNATPLVSVRQNDSVFWNRDNELTTIYSDAPSCFLYISSPPYCGKTALLQKLRDEAKHRGWDCVLLISMPEPCLVAARSEIDVLDYISNELGLGSRVGLAGCLNDNKKKILILIDNFHNLRGKEKLKSIFPGVLHFIKTECNPQINNFRMVIAGRYLTSHNFVSDGMQLSEFKEIKLNPFEDTHIYHILETALRERNIFLPHHKLIYQQWSQDIRNISSGHPKMIDYIIGYIMHNAPHNMLPDKYVVDNEALLFQHYSEPLLEKILSGISEESQKLLSILSVFNWFDMGTITRLIEDGLIERQNSIISIIGKIEGMIQKTTDNGGFHVEPILRDILRNSLKYSDEAFYQKTTQYAVEYFYNLFKRESVEYYAVQSAHHILQIGDAGIRIHKLKNLFRLFKEVDSRINIDKFRACLILDYDIAKFVRETYFPLEELLQALNNDRPNT